MLSDPLMVVSMVRRHKPMPITGKIPRMAKRGVIGSANGTPTRCFAAESFSGLIVQEFG